MNQALAAAAAIFYGFADFAGGFATRQLSVWKVMAWAQLLGLGLLAVGLVVVPATEVTGRDLFFGAVAGFVGLVGLVVLYLSLAQGTMAVVAPVSGAVAAAVPVVVDVVFGPGLSTRQWVGVGLALAAVALVGMEPGVAGTDRRWLAGAIFSGISFGVFYVALGQTDAASGLWPLVAARGTSIPIAFVIAGGLGVAAVPGRRYLGLIALIGNLDMAANVFSALALQRGPAGVTAVVVSLYPAVTAATAMVLLRERPSGRQLAGIGFALGALIALVG
jgi:drug/metabolite transporter (DMT)-like permease